MWWMLLAQGAASAAQTAQSNKASRKQIEATNKMAAKADRATVANTAQAISALNYQNGQARVDAARQLHEAETAAYAATGGAVANASAAAVKGASTDAVVNDIDRELGEAQVRVEQNLEIQQYNLTNRLREVVAGASSQLRGQQNPYANEQSPLLNGLISAGGTYLNNYMQFGGGFKMPSFGAGDAPAAIPSAAGNTAAGMTFSTGT